MLALRKKNCNGNKTFSGSPHMKYHNPLRCARVDTGQTDTQGVTGGTDQTSGGCSLC